MAACKDTEKMNSAKDYNGKVTIMLDTSENLPDTIRECMMKLIKKNTEITIFYIWMQTIIKTIRRNDARYVNQGIS